MKKIKLGDVSEIRNGSTPSTAKPENYGGQISWATPKDLSDNPEKYFYQGARNISEEGANSIGGKPLPKDSILLTSRAPIGLLAINKKETFTNQGFKSIIVDKKKVSEEYLFYFLKNNISNLINLGGGTTFKEISKSVLEQIEFYIPSLSKQKNIAKILSDIDSMISLNKKINEELEQMAHQIYEYWFLQFDFPDENGNPYKSSGGKMVQSNILKREIPIEWEVKELKDILVNITDKSEKIRSENILNDGIFPVITQDKGEIIKGYTNNKKPIKINPLLIFGDHSCTLKYVDFPFFRGADGTQILNFSNDKLTRYCYFSIQKFLPQIPNFGKYERHFKYLKAMPIVLPSIKVLNNFDGFAKSIFKKIEHNNIEIYNLEKQRDYLLPMLMNGQINVDNIQVK